MCLKSCDIGLVINKIIDDIIVRDVLSVSPIIAGEHCLMAIGVVKKSTDTTDSLTTPWR